MISALSVKCCKGFLSAKQNVYQSLQKIALIGFPIFRDLRNFMTSLKDLFFFKKRVFIPVGAQIHRTSIHPKGLNRVIASSPQIVQQEPALTEAKFRALVEECVLSENSRVKPKDLKENLHIKKIVGVIRATRDSRLRSDLINSLYVLFGIKPVLVIEYKSNQEIFKNLFSNVFGVKCVEIGAHLYLINETPLKLFDPRRFINNFEAQYQTIEGLMRRRIFDHQNEEETDKQLSYALGFGPCWEAYAGISQREYFKNSSLSGFSDEHYAELGESLSKREGEALPKTECIVRGKKYSQDSRQHKWPRPMEMLSAQETLAIQKLYMNQVTDPVSFFTSYIQTGIKCRRRLLALLEIPEDHQLHRNPS